MMPDAGSSRGDVTPRCYTIGMLYLFRSARRPLYRMENLRPLAAEWGTVMEVAYNRSWVATELFEQGAIARRG